MGIGVNKALRRKNQVRRLFLVANNQLLGCIENLLVLRSTSALRYPPVFFIGAPRSGSTLAVQVVTDAFDFGYISNRHCAWFGAPALAERCFRPLKKKPQSDYFSQQGQTSGDYAPSECGRWWYRFFRRHPPYVRLDEVSARKMRQFRGSVVALTNAFDRPVLFKNLYASLRIQAIAHYIPESLFIVIHRNEVDAAHSILESRYKRFGVYDKWFSVEPPEVEDLKKLPVAEQAIEQVRHIYTTIGRDLKRAEVPEKQVFHLDYESFCLDVYSELDKLGLFLANNDCQVSRVKKSPRKFARRHEVRIDKDLFLAVQRYADGT